MKLSKKSQVSNWMGDRQREYNNNNFFCLDLLTQCEYQSRPNVRLLTHLKVFVHMSRNCQCTECDYQVTQKGSLVIIRKKHYQ